jgi:hypothetical protein
VLLPLKKIKPLKHTKILKFNSSISDNLVLHTCKIFCVGRLLCQTCSRTPTTKQTFVSFRHKSLRHDRRVSRSQISTPYLFAPLDSSFGKYYDTIISVNLYGFGDTIRVARVVDVSGQTPAQSRIDHSFFVQSEHVNSTILQKLYRKLSLQFPSFS